MKRQNDLFAKMTKSKVLARQELFCEILFKEIQEHFLLDTDYVLNRTRKREYVTARQIGMYLLSKHTKISLTDIGRLYAKDHATVIHAKKVVSNLMDVTKTFKAEVKSIEKKILTRFNVFSKTPKSNEQFYYINFNNHTSIRFTDNKGMILTGFKDSDIQKFMDFLRLSKYETMKHKKTGHYILEQKEK